VRWNNDVGFSYRDALLSFAHFQKDEIYWVASFLRLDSASVAMPPSTAGWLFVSFFLVLPTKEGSLVAAVGKESKP